MLGVCAATYNIACMNCQDGSVRALEGEKIKGRYMRDAKTKRDHIGTISGDEEARHVAAYARVAYADRAGRAISLTLSAYTWGLPTIACICIVSPRQSTCL